MRAVSKRSNMPEAAPWKLLLWTAVAGLIFGLIGFGEIAEDWLRVARNSFHKHNASGDIVILTIDDKSLHEIGNWPWPRRTDAQLIDRLTAAGAKRIFFDVNFSFVSNPADDAAFADAIKRSKRVTLFARPKSGPVSAVQNGDDSWCRCRSSQKMRSSAPQASSTIIKTPCGRCPMRQRCRARRSLPSPRRSPTFQTRRTRISGSIIPSIRAPSRHSPPATC